MTRAGGIKRIIHLLRNRPVYFLRAVRCYGLFHWTRWCNMIFPQSGIAAGENVRLQKRSSLMAEMPEAHISVGAHSIIYEDARIEAYRRGRISIGNCSIIGGGRIFSRYQIDIGSHFLCSWDVFIQDYDAHPTDAFERHQQIEQMAFSFRPNFSRKANPVQAPLKWDFPGEAISIGDDVWVGAGVTILKGAQIGSGCIIASGAVVLRGVYPPFSLLAGNPAKVVKQLRHDASESPAREILAHD